MKKEEFKKVMYILMRSYMKLNKMKSDQETIKSLVEMHLDDAEHVSLLHRQLKDANEKIRELETQLYLERKARKQ